MSFPQEELHEIASANMPTTPIKPTSTWVAILLHTKDDIEDIDKEDDFLWIKCHDVSFWAHPDCATDSDTD